MHPLDRRPYFFDAGIRFSCRRCGACCTGEPGIVRVSTAEVKKIAEHLNTAVTAIVDAYLLPWENGYRAREMADGRCIFFEDGCRIYPVRPVQCRTFPFWIATLRSLEKWQATCRACPGIGTGRRYDRDAILEMLSRGD